MAGAGDTEPPGAWSAETVDDEWLPIEPAGEEELLAGPRTGRGAVLLQRAGERFGRLHRGVRAAVAVLVGAVALGLVVHSGALGHTGTDRPSGRAAATNRSQPTGVADRPYDALIIAKALSAAPLTDYTRSTAQPGECALVSPRSSPTRALMAAVRRALPAFRLRDLSRTLDQSTGLCALDLRADDRRGTTAIVEVVAPTGASSRPFALQDLEVTSDGTTATSIVSTRTRTGWSVTVATVGPIADLPESAAMVALTEDTSLLW